MKDIDKMICCKCKGLGSFVNSGGMIDHSKKLGIKLSCEICNGSGYTNNLFAIEFEFDLTNQHYWLPMLILADNKEKAVAIANRKQKEMGAYYFRVSHTAPLGIIREFLNIHFQMDFSSNKRYKFALLSTNSRSIIEPEGKPSIRINEHLQFRATNSTLNPSIIKDASNKNKFPVRVIKGDTSFDPVEHLIILYQKRMNFKQIFTNSSISKNYI
jgi:hypothetical protein